MLSVKCGVCDWEFTSEKLKEPIAICTLCLAKLMRNLNENKKFTSDYAKTVRNMRSVQRDYFKNRSPISLELAKTQEKIVDRLTDEILARVGWDAKGGK